MKEQLIHIFDQSVCFSRKQMKEYLSGAMLPEEIHAAEIHLNTCPLCSMAMEGFEAQSDEALAAIASLNSGFLKEHFDNIAPQIHLNSIAHAATMPAATARSKGNTHSLWRNVSVAAALVLAVGAFWFIQQSRKSDAVSTTIALADESPVAGSNGPARMSDALPLKEAAPVAAPVEQQQPAKVDIKTGAVKNVSASTEAFGTASSSASGQGSANRIASAGNSYQPDEADQEVATKSLAAAAPPVATEDENVAEQKRKDEQPLRREYSPERGLLAGGPRSASTSAPGRALAKPAVESAKTAEDRSADLLVSMERGNESFKKGKYSAALSEYKKQMVTGSARDRMRATIKAAESYAAMGNTARAEELLQKVISDGDGPERRAAKRVLRRLR